jgi:anaerobic selenocysteine-containing dehydrogenase
MTGVAANRIERLGHRLAELQPAVAFVGGAPLAHTNGLFTALAVNALNALLGNIGQPGGIYFTPGNLKSEIRNLKSQDLASAKVLLLADANPVFDAPRAWKVREALAAIPFIASFGSFIDDTSAHADLLLPDHSFLESWVDSAPESGSMEAATTAAGPVMKPLYSTRATADVLIEVAGKLKTPVKLSWKTAEEVAKSTEAPAPTSAISNPQSAMKGKLQSAMNYAEPAFDGEASQYPFHFLPYASPQFGDGSSAHLPWLQEMPDPMSTAMWSTWVEINPQTASKLGIGDADMVEIASAHGSIHAPAVISPGIAPDVIAMPTGQGHETFTRYASGRGSNPVKVLAPVVEPETGALAWAATRVKVTRIGEPKGELIRYGGALREFEHHRG